MDTKRLLNEIAEAIAHDDEGRLTSTLYELGTIAMMAGAYNNDAFTSVVSILQTEHARKADTAWLVWKHFEENWDLISDGSREKVRRAAEDEFGRSDSWMWSFTIGTLFAECFADEAAMDALMRFRKVSDSHARAVLPDAIRSLARRASGHAIKTKARRELELLSHDPSAEVRSEAALALARWK